MSLSDASTLGRDASELTDHLRESSAGSYEDLGRRNRSLVDKIAEAANTKSSAVRETLRQTAEYAPARTRIPRGKCFDLLEREAIRQTKDMIVERTAAGAFRSSPDPARSRSVGGVELADRIADLRLRFDRGNREG